MTETQIYFTLQDAAESMIFSGTEQAKTIADKLVAEHYDAIASVNIDAIASIFEDYKPAPQAVKERIAYFAEVLAGCGWTDAERKQIQDKKAELLEGETPNFIYFDKNGSSHISENVASQYFRRWNRYIWIGEEGTDKPTRYLYKGGVYKPAPDSEFHNIIRNYIESYYPHLATASKIKAIASLIFMDTENTFFTPSSLNSDEDIINFKNGIYNIKTKKIMPHSPEIKSTIQISATYEAGKEEQDTPVFDAFIEHLSSSDAEIKRMLLQYLGVAISNIKGYRFRTALWLYGDGGSGKSQFLKLAESFVGAENSAAIQFENIEKNRFMGATIFDKRFVYDADITTTLDAVSIGRYKTYTGGDKIFCERKGKDGFSACFGGLMAFNVNDHLPYFSTEGGEHIEERFIPIFCKAVPAENRDKHLLEKMFAERDGIIQKAINALDKVLENGYNFDVPAVCKEAIKKHLGESDPVSRFCTECLVRADNAKDGKPTTAIYNAFRFWCDCEGLRYITPKRDFKQRILKYYNKTEGTLVKTIHGKEYYLLKPAETQEAQDLFKSPLQTY